MIQIDSKVDREILGLRTRSPRWAIALKFEPRKEVTIVEDIVVQVGRTGKLTPVALLRPVDVSGVTVSRATLHNAGEVAKKDIRVGDTVRIERAGDVIPAVVERIPQKGERRKRAFAMPAACPVCGSEVVEEGAYHFCTGGLSCPAQLKRGIEHFASKGALDIEGLGAKTVAALVDRGLVASVADIYRLDEKALLALDGFADKSAANLLAAIESSKKIALDRFLYALGIREVGEHVAAVLAARYETLDAVMERDRGGSHDGPRDRPRGGEERVELLRRQEEQGPRFRAPAARPRGGGGEARARPPAARGADVRFHRDARRVIAGGSGASRPVARRPRELDREQKNQLPRGRRRSGLEAREGGEARREGDSRKMEFKKLVGA